MTERPDGLPVAPESSAQVAHDLEDGGRTGALRMGTDLVRAFSWMPPEQAAGQIATHITKFWDPRMRRELLAHIRRGDTSLPPVLVRAAEDFVDGDISRAEVREPSGG